MKTMNRLTAGALAIALGASILTVPVAARASEEGRRNTALGLGAAAAALLLTQKNKLPGIIAGAGAAYAYSRYNDAINDRHKREDYWYGRNGRDRYDRNDRYDSYDRGDYRDRYDNRDNRYDRDRRDNRYYDRRDNRHNDDNDYRHDRRR